MNQFRRTLAAGLLWGCALGGAAAQQPAADAAVNYAPEVGQAGKDVIWVPTRQDLVERMLDMAKLTPQDYLVDLGSGDGRTVITAAKRGARAHGIEFNPDMVALSKRAAQAEGVADRATFEQADIFQSDFSKADVVTLFLLPHLNLKLRPTLLDMKPGTRVVSNAFTMDEWTPDLTIDSSSGCPNFCTAHLWIVPAKAEGAWTWDDKELTLVQTFQKVEGTLRSGGVTTPISEGRLQGAQLSFKAGDVQYQAQVSGDAMEGTAEGAAGWKARRQSR